MDDFKETLSEAISGERQRFYGKYRGTVVSNVDPQNMARITAIVPDVSAVIPTGWAMPSVPHAFLQYGLIALPPVGAGVWIEFENGDPDFPIWSGGWWGEGQAPILASAGTPVTPNIVMQTAGQNAMVIFGAPGAGITLVCGPIVDATAPRIMITRASIVISNGAANITVTPSSVIINNGALTIT